MRTRPLAILVVLVGCDGVGDPAPKFDCVAGPQVLPSNPACQSEPLTSASVPAWLSFVMCSPSGIEDTFEQQIEAHRGDEGITDALFAVVDASWQYDGTIASCTDWQAALFALGVIRALRDPAAFVRLDALVWRPLPARFDHEVPPWA